MLEKILKKTGLSTKEAEMYIAAIRTGSSPIRTIAKRAGISRSTGYNLLQNLYKTGFVKRFDRAGIQHYCPIPPCEIKDLLERKKEEIDQKISLIETYLPQFEAIRNPVLPMPKVSFFEGINGIKQIYHDILKKPNKETLAALSLDNVSPELKTWLIKSFTLKKIKKNISSKVLISSKNGNAYKKLDKKHLRESIVIPSRKNSFEVEIDIYDNNKTAFISYDESELFGVIIESPKIANTLKALLSLIWEKNSNGKNNH